MDYTQEEICKRFTDEDDLKAIHFAIVGGCLNGLYMSVKGQSHKKEKRCLSQLHGWITGSNYQLKLPKDTKLYEQYIEACNEVFMEITAKSATRDHVLLNLAATSLDNIYLDDKYRKKFAELFDLFPGAWNTKGDPKHGKDILVRIDEALKDLQFQEIGVV